MSRLSLRLRIALASAAGILLAVAALGFAAQFLVGHELRASQDRGLRARAGDVARLSASAPALLTSAGALDSPSGGQALLVEVLDRRGRIVARSAALGGRLLPTGALVAAAIRSGHTGYTHAPLSGDRLRVFVAPLPDAGGPAAGGAVLVAAGEGEIDRTANHVRTLILLCALGAAGLGAAITAVLTRRGLAPLRRLSAAATDIERTGDPTRRLPAAGSGGEIAELTRTLNAMLLALDQARGNERRFLADASHELRTPVATLRGNIEYLGRHGADRETVADLRAEAERLSRLVDNLLVLERQPQDGVGDEAVALDEVARLVVAGHPEPITLSAASGAVVRGDPEALRRAVDNLVANAVMHGAPPVAVAVAVQGGRARVSVSDAGAGLAPGDAEHAFRRFWRGPGARARGGSGLGLAIVRATARAHGGDVAIDGATFTLDLPAIGPAPDTVRDSSESAPSVDDVPLPG
ncbi:MAG: two-component system, OmpR family, sensor kinase [Baekduia sp.]|jgi:two-component system OmpR family sensor kinase|nr:two-component system, OmpR family, sensor kinase [Baekduia sp.]